MVGEQAHHPGRLPAAGDQSAEGAAAAASGSV